MKCRGSELVGIKASATISHCQKTNTTNAVLFCSSHEGIAYIRDAVTGIAQVATHPAFIPTLLSIFHLDLLDHKVHISWGRLFDVETASGQSGISLVTNAGCRPTGDCDDPDLSKKVIGVVQLAIAFESYSQSNIEIIDSINKFVASYNPEPGTIQVEHKQILEEYLGLVFQKGSMVLYGVRHLRARADVQVSTVRIQQRANRFRLMIC